MKSEDENEEEGRDRNISSKREKRSKSPQEPNQLRTHNFPSSQPWYADSHTKAQVFSIELVRLPEEVPTYERPSKAHSTPLEQKCSTSVHLMLTLS